MFKLFETGHSFRIGAASFAAEKSLSDAQVRFMGRWNSNAFRKYIRSNYSS
jgi:RES domain-containing protein